MNVKSRCMCTQSANTTKNVVNNSQAALFAGISKYIVVNENEIK